MVVDGNHFRYVKSIIISKKQNLFKCFYFRGDYKSCFKSKTFGNL